MRYCRVGLELRRAGGTYEEVEVVQGVVRERRREVATPTEPAAPIHRSHPLNPRPQTTTNTITTNHIHARAQHLHLHAHAHAHARALTHTQSLLRANVYARMHAQPFRRPTLRSIGSDSHTHPLIAGEPCLTS